MGVYLDFERVEYLKNFQESEMLGHYCINFSKNTPNAGKQSVAKQSLHLRISSNTSKACHLLYFSWQYHHQSIEDFQEIHQGKH